MSRADVSRLAVASIFCVALVLPVIPAQAQTYSVLYDVPGGTGMIQNPAAGAMAQGRDGNLYTTSEYGGTDYGTLFKITPAGAVTLVNDSITGFIMSGVTLGTDGNFYGT